MIFYRHVQYKIAFLILCFIGTGCSTTPGSRTRTMPHLSSQEKCLAEAIHGEARGETLDGKLFVGRVILTRLQQGYGRTICEIVHAKNQFAPLRDYNEDSANAAKKAMSQGANGITHFHSYKVLKTAQASFSQSPQCSFKKKVGAHWGFACYDRAPSSLR